jgi:hypothetical protein
MKLAIITLFLSFAAFAAPKTIETGLYKAVDVETGDINATLLIREDKTLNFTVKTSDFTMPDPGCEGKYLIEENLFLSDLNCPLDSLSQISVSIDITDVTPESVRSEKGVNVDVKIDALGEDAFKFVLHKVD